MKNNFKGGMSSDLTAFDVAKKWKISPIEFMPILEKGTEHEMEHTDDKDIARRIALDHIVERLDYYDLLDKIEKMKIGGVVKKPEIFNDITLYYEKKGNWLFAKGNFYAWLFDEKGAGTKLENGEYDFIMFPPMGKGSVFSDKYVPPLLMIWDKTYQKKFKGINHLLGIVKGFYDEDKNQIIIDMMTTNPKFRRQGINAHIIKNLREVFEVSQDDVIFDKPTKEGKLFESSKKYENGGLIAPNGEQSNLTPEQWHLVRTPDFKGWFGFWDLYAYSKANEYYEPSVRKIAKELKENKLSAIEEVANFLSRQVTEDDVLIPMPSRSGISTDTKNLAEKISEKTGAKIFDCLVGRKRESIYQLKKRNEDVSDFDFEFQINCDIPKAKNYFIVDNVIATGVTMKNALKNVMDKVGYNVSPLVYAIDLNYISKVVDENGEPLVVYHGTNNQFNVFKPTEYKRNFGTMKSNAFFFAKDKIVAEYITELKSDKDSKKIILPVFLNIKNLLDFTDVHIVENVLPSLIGDLPEGDLSENMGYLFYMIEDKEISDEIKKMNYDGVELIEGYLMEQIEDLEGDIIQSYAVFEPNQIKFADGTNTTFDGKNPDIRFGKGGLIAPNGEQSNLTPELYKLVRTEAFKNWFGDWENDPKNSSKVVDDNGEPLVVYHGTKYIQEFYDFDLDAIEDEKVKAFFFSKGYEHAERYTWNRGSVKAFFLKAIKLFDPKLLSTSESKKIRSILNESVVEDFIEYNYLDGLEEWKSKYDSNMSDEDLLFYILTQTDSSWQVVELEVVQDYLKSNDYNGFITYEQVTNQSTPNINYAVFEPNQIKLADGTNTTFDGNNPDIRFDNGGDVETFYTRTWADGTIEKFSVEDYEKNILPHLENPDFRFEKGGDVNSEIEKIAKSVVFDLGEQYSENDYLGKCKEISEEIAKRLNQIDIKAIPMRIIDGEDKKYNSPVFNHAYTFIPMTNQIIDTQLWQVDGNPTDLNSRKVLFDFDDYNNLVELYEVEPIFDWENKFAKGGLIAPNTTFEKGGRFDDQKLLKEYNANKSIGFSAIAHLKSKGLIPRADGTKRKSEKYMEDGGINLSNKELMAHDFFNEQKELQRNSKYAILLDASWSNYTNEQREVFNNLKDELIDKLGFNPLINYSPFGSGVLNNRGNVILMFDDDSNLLGLLEFTIEPKYTIVPRYSPDYIKPEPIFENNENVFYLEYIFSFSRGNGQKMMNLIKKYADQYNVDIGLEGSIVEGTEGKPIASAKHLQRFYDKQGFINVRGHYFLYNPNSMAEGGELSTENKIYEITRHYFGSLRASSMGGYFNIEGVSLRIKNHLANWNNFYEYHLKNIDENLNPYFLSIVINSGNSYKDQDEADINTEEFVNDHIEENTNLKAEEIVFDSSDTIEDIIYIIDKKMKKMTSMAKGGKTIAQTPAPASDRVSGSKTNPKGSASDTEMARSIKFNDSLLKAIENKVKAHNEEYPSKKVTTPTAKAVVRRGMGAYSKSHRPFITGGAPNSRQAWGLARLNKFLLKKRGVKVKSAYIQDDDLL